MSHRARRFVVPVALALAMTACERDPQLSSSDLSPEERTFVTRYITLERARAVAFAHPDDGAAVLDSLAVVWDDSLPPFSTDPDRVAQVYALLERLLAAEADSLVQVPEARRLTAPLPQPDRVDEDAPE